MPSWRVQGQLYPYLDQIYEFMMLETKQWSAVIKLGVV